MDECQRMKDGRLLPMLPPGQHWVEVRGGCVVAIRSDDGHSVVLELPESMAPGPLKRSRHKAARRQHRQPSDECA